MTAEPLTAPTTADYLSASLRLGEPDVCGPLAVYPIFGPEPGIEYRAFAQAVALGASVKELDGTASVNDLVVMNPTDLPVLLYEGEEVLGAQQNRTFDVSVLVAAGARLEVPVSCVESGRWDGARHREDFSPAPQTAYPQLRRLKNRQARAAVAAGMEARAIQGAVWEEVANKSARLGVESATDAMHDIYDARRERLRQFRAAIPVHDGQLGALVQIAGEPVVLDHVSRPEVFAALHGPLVEGYALDAVDTPETLCPDPVPERAAAFLETVVAARLSERDGIGIGREVRFDDGRVAGAGLVAGKELVQVTAFAENEGSPPQATARRARIGRPSHRRAS